MTSLTLDVASVARARLAANPAYETLSWAVRAVTGRRHRLYGAPSADAIACLHDDCPALADIAAVVARTGRSPDFLTPTPSAASTDVFADQVAAIEATSDDEAATQFQQLGLADHSVPVGVLTALDRGRVGQDLAASLHRFWSVSLGDGWETIEARLTDEIAMRSGRWSRLGFTAFVDTLGARTYWTGRDLHLDFPGCNAVSDVFDQDLVFTPMALCDSTLAVQVSATEAWVGFAAASDTAPVRDGRATAALLGPSRARLLDLLASPRSTHEVASVLGLAPATVSYHLGVLHRAGVVTRQRAGRYVHYQVVGTEHRRPA